MQIVITLAGLGFVIYRNTRPQRMTATRFWILPVLLLVLTGFSMYGMSTMGAAANPLVAAVAIVIGGAIGIFVGALRGRHSEVRLTSTPGVFYIHPSAIVLLIWFGAFAFRFALRVFLPQAGGLTIALSDGLIVFAVVTVLAARWVIYQKYLALRATAPLKQA